MRVANRPQGKRLAGFQAGVLMVNQVKPAVVAEPERGFGFPKGKGVKRAPVPRAPDLNGDAVAVALGLPSGYGGRFARGRATARRQDTNGKNGRPFILASPMRLPPLTGVCVRGTRGADLPRSTPFEEAKPLTSSDCARQLCQLGGTPSRRRGAALRQSASVKKFASLNGCLQPTEFSP